MTPLGIGNTRVTALIEPPRKDDAMYVLLLNDMRCRAEQLEPVARACSKEALAQFIQRESVPSYQDQGTHTIVHDTDAVAQMAGGPVREDIPSYCWSRHFRKGGPLEWFNPPLNADEAFRHVGSADDWAEKARREWTEKIGTLPEVSL